MNGTTPFHFDPAWFQTLSSQFMVNGLVAGVLISICAGVVGYFTICRRSAFAAHALADIGLPGATGVALLGLPAALTPVGLGIFALIGGIAIGILGKKASQREIATGTILALAMGFGMFFARMSGSASQQMQSILFGSILTITQQQIIGVAVFDVILLIGLWIIYRPLLFSSIDEQVAEAKGVNVKLMSVLFMVMLAGTITVCVQAVGTLLIFALVITPAASANYLTSSPKKAMVIAGIICLICIWGGLVISAMFPTPPSFVIVILSTAIWAVVKAIKSRKGN